VRGPGADPLLIRERGLQMVRREGAEHSCQAQLDPRRGSPRWWRGEREREGRPRGRGAREGLALLCAIARVALDVPRPGFPLAPLPPRALPLARASAIASSSHRRSP